MVDTTALAKRFFDEYGRSPSLFSAPGRVNLIGDHTDYNDGFVLPIAIGRRTVVAAAQRSDRKVRVRSLGVAREAEFDLDRADFVRRHDWMDYVEGVARSLESRGARIPGADLLVDSDVPIGAGLSSSAALEMSAALAFTSLTGQASLSPRDLAVAAQSAEQTYVGTQCGIMDQMVAAFGRADHALLIDCRSLATTEIPCALAGAALVVCDTKVKHELAGSAYNERRRECETSVSILRAKCPHLRALRDLSREELDVYGAGLSETMRRRCRHVVSENERTLAAAEALSSDDLAQFGELMAASHASLRDDYEVSCPELDLCVEIAADVRGVYGARMTGGGFGGCTVSLVASDALDELRESLDRGFQDRFRKRPDMFTVRASEGMKVGE
jgi:galactokinase